MAGVRCLQRKLDKLARSLHPVTVSTALLAEEIIEQRAWEEARREGLPHYDRCLNLLEVVMRCVRARPSVYEQFCRILEQEVVTEGLAAELRDSLLSQTSENVKGDILERRNKKHEDAPSKGEECSSTLQKEQNKERKSSNVSRGKEEESRNTSHKRCRDTDDSVYGRAKEGRVSGDKFLMDVAWEVGEKWEELGVALGVEYKVLQSVVGSQVGKPVHMKAFYMLCEWKSRSGGRATYMTLAEALEESGLNSCAEEHCYNVNEKS